jgi:hypothetical protein
MIRNPEAFKTPLFLNDVRHGTTKLHRFLGSMIVGYLQEEACRAAEDWEAEEASREGKEERAAVEGSAEVDGFKWPGVEQLGMVPKVRLPVPPFSRLY